MQPVHASLTCGALFASRALSWGALVAGMESSIESSIQSSIIESPGPSPAVLIAQRAGQVGPKVISAGSNASPAGQGSGN